MITSSSNGQMKQLVKLQKSGKARKEKNCFVVEGIRMVQEIPKTQLQKVYVTEDFFLKNKEMLQNIDYELVSDSVLKEVSDTKTPQGILALVEKVDYSIEQICGKENPSFLVLENLQDPGNVGTLIRTAEGAGVTAVLLSQDTVDLYNPKVIRSTMGSIFRVPTIVLTMEEIFAFLEKEKIVSFAAHLLGENFYQENYKEPCAFFIGNEGNGLTEKTTNRIKKKIKIPMCGEVESLNAAIAGTVLMYEMMRQRMS